MTQALFHTLAALDDAGRTFVVATIVGAGGSTPRLAGAQMVITEDGAEGTIGGGALEWAAIERARALLADPHRQVERLDVHLVRDLGMCCGGKMEVFMQKHSPAPRLIIFGAGHIGTALAHSAAGLGFEITVVDERPEWAEPQRLPASITVVEADPIDHLRAHPPRSDDRILVVTHDHGLDEDLIRHVAPSEAAWVGLVGSRGKWARFRHRLAARGVEEAALDRVRCPVGLDIGALTPEEIAVSVMAELIAHRRGVAA